MLNSKSAIETPVIDAPIDELKRYTRGMLRVLHQDEGVQSSYQVIGCFQPLDANLIELPTARRQCIAIAYEGDIDTSLYSVLTWAHVNGALSAVKLIDVDHCSVHLVLNEETRVETVGAVEAKWVHIKNWPWPEEWEVCVVDEAEVLAGLSDTPHPELAADLLKSIIPVVERLWKPAIDFDDGVPAELQYEAEAGLIDYLDDPLLPEKLKANLQTPTPLRFNQTPLGGCGATSDPQLPHYPCLTCGDSVPACSVSKYYEALHRLTGHEAQHALVSYLQVAQEASISRENGTFRSHLNSMAAFLAYLDLDKKNTSPESNSED